jgi:hypothetical protein
MGKLKNKVVKPTLNRPSIDLDRTHSPRVWKDVEAQTLDIGDTVAGMGLILYVGNTCRDEVSIEAGIPDAKDYFLNKTDIVKAFVKKEN